MINNTNQFQYFWESDYKFGKFLQKIFQDKYRRKYSLVGNGIYNLVTIDNKIYEIKYTESKKGMIPSDNHAIDIQKKYIIDEIVNNLKCESNISGGKFITFPIGKWVAKVEIIKKLKEPT